MLVINLLLVFILQFCATPQTESITLIPKGYTGIIVIIFDQADGVMPEMENGKRVYIIPNGGVLKTQAKANYKLSGHKYYYVDSLGNREPIKYLYQRGLEDVGETFDSVKSTNGIFAYGEEMGATANNKPNYKKFRVFIVSPKEQQDSLLAMKSRIVSKVLLKTK